MKKLAFVVFMLAFIGAPNAHGEEFTLKSDDLKGQLANEQIAVVTQVVVS